MMAWRSAILKAASTLELRQVCIDALFFVLQSHLFTFLLLCICSKTQSAEMTVCNGTRLRRCGTPRQRRSIATRTACSGCAGRSRRPRRARTSRSRSRSTRRPSCPPLTTPPSTRRSPSAPPSTPHSSLPPSAPLQPSFLLTSILVRVSSCLFPSPHITISHALSPTHRNA